MTGHHRLLVNQNQWIRPGSRLCLRDNLAKIRADLRFGDIIILDTDTIAINTLDVPLYQLSGLRRRPTRASTTGTDFVPAVSQHDNLH